jgi:acetyl-CoA carboxylase carboxyl transferase subunit beta
MHVMLSTHDDLSARALIDRVVDAGTWQPWDPPIAIAPATGSEYAAVLAEARQRTGLDEAILTGEALLRGRRVAIVVGEFGFIAGTIGVAAAECLVYAVERATCEGLPLLAAPASGGTRIQEGTWAFVQMTKISQAIMAHRASGLPYLVYLRHPTTGGVFASWGSLGHVTFAEPGALLGFIGPRVYQALHGEPFPPGVQTAENLCRHRLIDALVAPGELADHANRALQVLCPAVGPIRRPGAPVTTPPAGAPSWESVRRSRRPDRPGIRRLLKFCATDVTPLYGAGGGANGTGLLVALARFGEISAVVIGHERGAWARESRVGPASDSTITAPPGTLFVRPGGA